MPLKLISLKRSSLRYVPYSRVFSFKKAKISISSDRSAIVVDSLIVRLARFSLILRRLILFL